MKIVTLLDNVVYGNRLCAEHGLSFYIESDENKVLFDTGQSDNFIKNAQILGIDISKVDSLILSHGHYDHTGGLEAFCRINHKAMIYAKEGLFVSKYKNKTDFIGTKYNNSLFDNRIRIVKKKIELYPNFFIMPIINIENTWDTHFNEFFIKPDKIFLEDNFEDEQFIVFVNNNKMNIISGCSHRGISNIIQSAVEIFQLPINFVLGGFHLKDADNDLTCRLIHELLKYDIERIGVCHCTGIEKYPEIKEVFKNKAFYSFTGNVIDELIKSERK